MFRFQDLNILMDVESGAIHSLDDAAAKVETALEKGEDPYSAGVGRVETDEILEDFRELAAAGSYDSPAQTAPEIQGGEAVKSMCLHVAHDCNLRCKYCFAGTGEFGGSRMIMPLETAKSALDFLMRASGSRRHLEVDLFGGEPLMNFPVCRDVVAYGRELEKRWNKDIHFTITTNCLALNDEIIDWVNREMHNVVISLDGRKEIHDALRPTAAGNGSFDRIVEKAQKLVSLRGDGEYYIRGTFTRMNLDFLEDVKALLGLGFRQISIEPVVLPAESPYSILPEEEAEVKPE